MRISDWSSDVCSSDLQPRPTPKRSRPPDSTSTSAACLATSAVCRCGRIITAGASSSVRVTAARNPSVTNGSWNIRSRVRSEEHTSELQSLMRISYAVFCLKKKTITTCTEQKQYITQLIKTQLLHIHQYMQ